MKKMWILLVALLVMAVSVVPASAITWGEPDTEHTNVGAMVVDWPDYGPWQWCSGTLIHPQVFLTAGHCTDGLDEYGIETIWVSFDEYALNELRDVKQVITHPEYGWGTTDPHDVGLLILKEPVKTKGKKGIQPAELPDEGFLDTLKAEGVLSDGPDKAPFTVVGYGGSLNWPPPEITYEDERQVAFSEYRALSGPWLHLSQNSKLDNGGTCFGDSGGPTFYEDKKGNETLVGVTSWGDAQCVATGFYYRVDIAQTLDFVNGVIAELEKE